MVAAVTATVSFTMIYFSNDCQPLDQEHAEEYPLQVDALRRNSSNSRIEVHLSRWTCNNVISPYYMLSICT